jgi:large exoprotein involved in heme utilization and adhesion
MGASVRGSELLPNRIIASASGESIGDAGRIIIHTNALTVANNGRIASVGHGVGTAGQLDLQVQQLTVSGGGQIAVTGGSNTTGTGSAGRGRLRVVATNRVLIDGQNQAQETGLFGQTFGNSRNPGLIRVSTPTLTIMGGGRLSTRTNGSGPAGQITLQANHLSVTGADSGVFSSTNNTGPAGIIRLQVQQLLLADGGRLSTSSLSQRPAAGAAGTIIVTAQESVRSLGGRVITEAQAGRGGTIRITAGSTIELTAATMQASVTAGTEPGGNIQLQAGDLVHLQESRITTAVGNGSGAGGNIGMDADLVILEQSQIIADAFRGRGSNIRIMARGLIADTFSQVSASSAQSIDGTVDIRTLTNLSGALAPLPQDFVQVTTVLCERCAERLRENNISSLFLLGRDGLPPEPAGMLPSPLELDIAPSTEPASTGLPQSLVHRPDSPGTTGLPGRCPDM